MLKMRCEGMIRYAMISSASARTTKVGKQLFSTNNNTLIISLPYNGLKINLQCS